MSSPLCSKWVDTQVVFEHRSREDLSVLSNLVHSIVADGSRYNHVRYITVDIASNCPAIVFKLYNGNRHCSECLITPCARNRTQLNHVVICNKICPCEETSENISVQMEKLDEETRIFNYMRDALDELSDFLKVRQFAFDVDINRDGPFPPAGARCDTGQVSLQVLDESSDEDDDVVQQSADEGFSQRLEGCLLMLRVRSYIHA